MLTSEVLSLERSAEPGMNSVSQTIRYEKKDARIAADCVENGMNLARPFLVEAAWQLLNVKLRLPESTFLILSLGFGEWKISVFP